MKTCFRCGRTLPLDDFYRHPMMADGRLGKCKECTRTDVALNREIRRDYYLQYQRERERRVDRTEYKRARRASVAGAVDRAIAIANYNERNPEAVKAHYAVNNAIRAGRLKRDVCEVCNAPKAQAHHDDYAKPLAVRWLCVKHHVEHHREAERS